ncbi:MAG: imidazole glycerol phosphate synthase subunit HisF [Candidatus Lambdaproteobacteria bacterium]|nr:imidazole glycerol phosphate synthase subunit HisF [Candidatus Lambdaproteobacteria bacterium]
MLAKRIIPCLDIKEGRVVKGVSFLGLRDAGDPLELSRRYNEQSADELVFLDITASHENRGLTLDLAARLARELFIPFTIGGGISSLEDIHRIVTAGADKVSINTAAVQEPQLISRGAQRFGSQCIVVAMDVKRSGDHWEVYTHGGRRPTGLDAEQWAQEVQRRGAGEILLTSMDADGQLTGYDLEITRRISAALHIPVIASGGGGTIDHFYDALTVGQADAVLAATVFHYGTYTVSQVKQALHERGVPVRLTPEVAAPLSRAAHDPAPR